MFKKKQEYIVKPDVVRIKDFHDNKSRYTIRPPYQRKSVWKLGKKQSLLDSIFRQYYIPKIVLREVKVSEENWKNEVVDGQQRILTVQEFFNDEIKLPDSLRNFSKEYDLTGKTYSKLNDEIKRYVDDLSYDIDRIYGIDDPRNSTHQAIATTIFQRLQEGEPLNFMEKLHARLASIARNFITYYADEIRFDFDKYEPVDANPKRHKFFSILNRTNERLENLTLISRFFLIELGQGPKDVGQKEVEKLIEDTELEGGIGKHSFSSNPEKKAASELITNLNLFYDIFKSDITIDGKKGVKELSTEYFIISIYTLLRYVRNLYVVDNEMEKKVKDFVINFYQRWKKDDENDNDMLSFRDSRQQDEKSLVTRDRIIRQSFFEFHSEAKRKDTKRTFNEAERIKIYRDHNGICRKCNDEGLGEDDARILWSQYEADHILAHSKGFPTDPEGNAQVLCRKHNREKGSN